MISKITAQIFSKEHPKWFRLLNASILLPILLWPFVFYTTIFFFDNPKNLRLTYLAFFVVNIYPIYLLTITYLNSKLFKKNKILGSILPTLTLTFLTFGIIGILFSMGQVIYKSAKRDIERANQGYIGSTDVWKIKNDKVYRYDTLVVGADAKSFEVISGSWQRDKSFYYYLGQRIESIDRQSFEDLGYHYGKDKFNVYYNEKVIIGADAKTFTHIEGTQDGKDKANCYRWGKMVDCEVLKSDY